jgi:hypothetical protein
MVLGGGKKKMHADPASGILQLAVTSRRVLGAPLLTISADQSGRRRWPPM